MANNTRRVPFLNCHFDNVTFAEVIETVRDHVQSRVPGFMVSMNADIVVRYEQDKDFAQAYQAADLVLMDSTPLIKVAHHCGIDVKERLSGSDLMPRICKVAAAQGWGCFFLGGREGVPEQAALNLQERFPQLVVAGTCSPEYGFERQPEGVGQVARIVRQAQPDLLFICLGTPKSEKILYPHLQEFNVPFTFSVGAAIDFAAGNIQRAPVWVQRLGFEWFFRFLQEPRRLFRRYFVDSWKLVGIYRRYRKG